MFKTKRDVDAHVNNLLRRLKDDKEKKNRGEFTSTLTDLKVPNTYKLH